MVSPQVVFTILIFLTMQSYKFYLANLYFWLANCIFSKWHYTYLNIESSNMVQENRDSVKQNLQLCVIQPWAMEHTLYM